MPSLKLSRSSRFAATGRRYAGLSVALAFLLLTAGCATGPQYPLYSPLAVTGDFGFTEQRLGDTSYQVTYITPRHTAYSPYARTEPRRTALLNLANDMALMRAAELALAQGYETFRVTQRDNNADINRERYHGWCDDPFWPRRPFYYPYPTYRCGPDGYTRFQARSTLSVEFGSKPNEEHYVAKDVLAQLAQTYPTARAIGSAKQ
jgi:hypothetical protein